MYSSHYVYLGLMTTLHTLYSFDIYDDVCFSPLSHVLFLLYLCTCFFAYITCLYFTLDALMDLV